jgi:hypothetical protein
LRERRDASDEPDGNGREARALVSLVCEVRQGSRPWRQARLDEISTTGFRISQFPDCSPQLPLRIRIPGLELLSATVRWQRDDTVGCEFASPLHVAVFEHIVRKVRQG